MSGFTSLRLLPLCVAAFFAGSATIVSCSDKNQETIVGAIDPEVVPTMVTYNVNTLISDSGYLRYRIIAPVWNIYDEARDPHWSFPEGMHMERFTPDMAIDATIDCDSAMFFTRRQLWRLDGAVDISSPDSQRFLTEQLFWSQAERKVYSDSFIHIQRPDRIMEGWGFVSNEAMTNYTLLNPSGIFPVSQFRPDGEPTTEPYTPANPYDPTAVTDSDPTDAQFTDQAFNGDPTDTLFVSTAAVPPPSAPKARRRALKPRRSPKIIPVDSTPVSDPGSQFGTPIITPIHQ